jgi:hypothetical protein
VQHIEDNAGNEKNAGIEKNAGNEKNEGHLQEITPRQALVQ